MEFRKILAVRPGHSDSRYGLALTLHRMKDYRTASVEWRNYLESAPDSRYSENARTFLKEAEAELSGTQGK
jgi:TolA-binding protein